MSAGVVRGRAAARRTGPVRVAMLTGSVSREAGGVFEALIGLSKALHALPDMELHVIGLRDMGTDMDLGAWDPVPVTASTIRGPRAFGFSAGFRPALARLRPDVVHVHGLWMYASVIAHGWASRTGAACVVSPHGMLDPWALANSAWKKRIVAALYQDRHLRQAGCLHALGSAEHLAIRALGLGNPVCTIANGVALPDPAPHVPAWRLTLPADARVLLYLGRLHPKKGLRGLLQAWVRAFPPTKRGWPWVLVVAGPDDSAHRAELEALAGHLGILGAIRFIGPQFGADKHAAFASADAFVLPSLSEGLPMAVLEAWSHCLPVLMTPECNLPEGFSAGAALRIGPEPQDTAVQLRRLAQMGAGLHRTMGAAGRTLVAERFTWPALAGEMASVYRWLLDRGPPPACVQIQAGAEPPARLQRVIQAGSVV